MTATKKLAKLAQECNPLYVQPPHTYHNVDFFRCKPFPLAVKIQLSSQPKISYFHFELIIEEEVTKLQISMDNSGSVEVCARLQYVFDKITGFGLCDVPSSFVQFHQRLQHSNDRSQLREWTEMSLQGLRHLMDRTLSIARELRIQKTQLQIVTTINQHK